MGKHERWLEQSSGLLPNGLLPNAVNSVTQALDAERWTMVEERTAELIACIQPNQLSEERRQAVANYVQRLIMRCLSCQVCTFGSVPLKTYLPDGDIDLTAFCNNEEIKETWANVVRDALENEEKSENAEFCVKEVHYIQAEVKIIKCLVENIVVDISFNQVGGLCTLCFLEEIDHLISNNHLFKRSIILIKAWCYYESRILGAPHGLISTYALETLVLYIFHVFNNSFAGPLEVLYRFLEFFSNFDWDNYCVSLWGPVPIGSLPDTTAEPPRRDSGDLLLGKIFLDTCSLVYAVVPGSQDNQSQPFVSKHFNVIDPLRTNNNLGRSVSKGNFFRIRSAFAFGAKRLARLLECPKEDLVAEVNQFFMNTWERHGQGNRPDAPSPNSRHSLPLKNILAEESNSYTTVASIKTKTENPALRVDQGKLPDDGRDYQESISQALGKTTQHPRNSYGSGSPSVSQTQSQKIYGLQTSSRVSDQCERNSNPSGSVQSERDQRAPKSNVYINDNNVQVQSERDQRAPKSNFYINDNNVQNRFHFARTRSSPELTDSSVEVLSHGRRVGIGEMEKTSRFDHSRRNNFISEVSGGQSSKSSLDDPVSSMNTSSHPSHRTVSDTTSVPNRFHDDIAFATTNEELASVSDTLDAPQMSQEDHDLVSLMASAKLHNFNGQVQLPVHMSPSRLPLTSSPLLGSIGLPQGNVAGIVPTNLPLVGPPWIPNMQFLQGFVPRPMSHYIHTSALRSNSDRFEPVHENSAATELNQDDADQWLEQRSGLNENFNHGRRDSQTLHFDAKQQSLLVGLNFASSSRSSMSGTDDGPNYADHLQNQTSRGIDTSTTFRSQNVRFPPASQASTSRSNVLYESSSDESFGKTSRSSRDKWGKQSASPTVPASLHGKPKTSQQIGSASERASAEVYDESRSRDPISAMADDMAEKATGSTSFLSSQLRNHQVPDSEPGHINVPNPLIPIPPIVVGPSRQRAVDNSGMVTFFPTGPPVPIFMLPVYNFTPDTGNSDGSATQLERNEQIDQFHANPTDQNINLLDNIDLPKTNISTMAASTAPPESSDRQKSDILNSDFASHWENLVYGRSCQNANYPGPFISSPVMVPPGYLQGHFPWDGPGKQLPANTNITRVMSYVPRLVPVMPLQPGSERGSNMFQRYREEAPRYRGGTGTYLPTPKVPLRERQSTMRNHRGNYNSDRIGHGDRDGNWSNAKLRATGRNHGRTQAERTSLRPDRHAATENQGDRQWSHQNKSYGHELVNSFLVRSSSFGSTNSTCNQGDMASGMYSPPSTSSNGISPSGPAIPPVVMVYSYDQGVSYGSSTEPLEFGSLGLVLSGINDVPRSDNEIPIGGLYEQRHGMYRGGSHSSPDRPSSSQLRR